MSTLISRIISILCILIVCSTIGAYCLEHFSEKKKLAIVMVNVGDKRGKYSAPLWQQYCDKWSHDFYQLTYPNTYDQKELHPSWWKIPLCKHVLLTGNYDYILHVDADTLPVNIDKNVTFYDQSFVVGKEPPSVSPRHKFHGINAGVFMFKNTEFSINMLNELWRMRHETRVSWPWEQGAIEEFISNNSNDPNILLLEYGTLQSFFLPTDTCSFESMSTCPTLVAHVLRGVHPDWEEKMQRVCEERGFKQLAI